MYFRVHIYNSQFKINGYTKQKTFRYTVHWKALCFLFYLSLCPVFFGNESSLHPSRSSCWVILGQWALDQAKCQAQVNMSTETLNLTTSLKSSWHLVFEILESTWKAYEKIFPWVIATSKPSTEKVMESHSFF